MLNLEDLTLFVEFYRLGTLTKVAEKHLISQPTLTRNMRRVEEAFGVTLFTRTANRLTFNEVGVKAVEQAEELLRQAAQCQASVAAYDRQLHSLEVVSCAPAPLWSLLPVLTRKNPGKAISSTLVSDPKQIEADFKEGNYDYAVLPYPLPLDSLGDIPVTCSFLEEENLFLNVPLDHELAKFSEVSADMINGYNCLLSPEIGFWESFCKTKLPNSRFLVQHDDFAFLELIRQSSLPCFTTDLAKDYFREYTNRVDIPITDAEAHAKFYLIGRA